MEQIKDVKKSIALHFNEYIPLCLLMHQELNMYRNLNMVLKALMTLWTSVNLLAASSRMLLQLVHHWIFVEEYVTNANIHHACNDYWLDDMVSEI